MAEMMITTWAACAAPAHDAEGFGLSQVGMRKGVSCRIRGCAQRRGSCGQGPCGHQRGLFLQSIAVQSHWLRHWHRGARLQQHRQHWPDILDGESNDVLIFLLRSAKAILSSLAFASSSFSCGLAFRAAKRKYFSRPEVPSLLCA